MRLDELKRYPEISDLRKKIGDTKFDPGWSRSSKVGTDVWNSIENMMAKYGYKNVGQGAFATVFINEQKPSEIVKIFSDDPNTVKWLKWCVANKGNPFVPQIKAKPVRIHNDWYVVRMERLEFNKSNQKEFAKAFRTLIDNWQSLKSGDLPQEYIVGMEKVAPGITTNPQLREVIEYLMDEFSDPWAIDINKGNVMMRGNQPVIIDPVYSFEN